jgi:hypothetical protein
MRIHDLFRSAVTPFVAAALLFSPSSLANQDDDDCEEDASSCERAASALRNAARHEARDDFWVGIANCLNLSDRAEARACFRENALAWREATELLAEQYEARLELCEALGGGRYDPRIDPDDFAQPSANPFFPLVPGTTRVLEAVTDEGTERVEVTVTFETRTILGVECTIVRDVVTLEGEIVEDTDDYFAADRFGNVWYFGELAMNFEDGQLTDLGGSWLAGMDGAKPGIVMEAVPAVGDTYRQEYLATEAEDAATVAALGRTVNVPFGTLQGCLETRDFTPLEPGQLEAKFYAPGMGAVLEVNLETGERLELVGIF